MKQISTINNKASIIRISLSLFILLSVFLLSFIANAYATTVRIYNPKIKVILPPGGSESGTITVVNPSGDTVDVKVYLEDWVYTQTQDGIKDFAPPGTTALSGTNLISFYPAEFTMSPFASQEISYMVKAPAGIEGGGRYAVLFFETVVGTTKDNEGVDILIKGRIGSLFYIKVEPIKKEAILRDISIASRGRGFQIDAVFKNIGNVDITAKGTFNVIDRQGMVFARGQFNDVYTFPGDQGRISSVWSDAIPAGAYDLIITLDLEEKPLVEETRINIDSSGEVRYVGSADE